MLDSFLNYVFFFFHTALMLFNSFGWIWKRIRKWNLLALLLTAFSWFILGIWYGWGYCLCTDWHWRVREHLGYHDMGNSYVQFLLQKITGITFPEKQVNIVTAVVFFSSIALSSVLNFFDYRKRRSGITSD